MSGLTKLLRRFFRPATPPTLPATLGSFDLATALQLQETLQATITAAQEKQKMLVAARERFDRAQAQYYIAKTQLEVLLDG